MTSRPGVRPNESGGRHSEARAGDRCAYGPKQVTPSFRLADFRIGDTVASVFGAVFIEARMTGGYRVREVDPNTLQATSSPYWMSPIASVFYVIETAADRRARAELELHR